MQIDRYSGRHSSTSAAAVAAFERAVANLAAHRPCLTDLDAALAHDPGLVAAHALRGIAQVTAASAVAMSNAKRQIAASTAALAAVGGGTAGEQALVAAHELAANGRLKAAAGRLETLLLDHPLDFLAAKLAHALRFMSGQAPQMLATTTAILPHWSPTDPGYGHLLGCHAFGLEETGQYRLAESAGRSAIAREPHDVWGLHAVAHVMEMRGRTRSGVAWLEPTRALWRPCGSFGFHLAWHLALFRLAEGDSDRALALYDEHLLPAPACDFRDMANAISMLWRLEQEGVDVGDRWLALEPIAEDRRRDTTNMFASLHYLIALVAAGNLAAAEDALDAIRRDAQRVAHDLAAPDQLHVARRIGLPLAQVIVDLARDGADRTDWAALARRLPEIGGSNAQRDVFLRTLLLVAADCGDTDAVSRLTEIRLAQRHRDHFAELIMRRSRRPAFRAAAMAAPSYSI